MKNKLEIFAVFTAGVAVGAASAWKFVKKKYEQIAQEEIDSVKESFSKKIPDAVKKEDVMKPVAKVDKTTEKPSIAEYAAILKKEGYDYSKSNASKAKEPAFKKPYVITPEEFGEFDEYEKISLTYYADQVLADENDEIMEDADIVVGLDSLSHFGEYEDDSVFVRNDRLKCDYEILLDQRDYREAIQNIPHRAEER